MIRYALLGLLQEQRDYGYHLKRRFDERVGTIWHLNIGQVYQTLRALERSGLISAIDGAPEAQGDDQYPARRLYELTAKGKRVLEQWLHRPPHRPRPVRDETLIRLLVLEPGRRSEALSRIEAQEHLYKKHLARLLMQKRRLPVEKDGAVLVSNFGLEAAILHNEAHLKWLEYCRQKLEESPEIAGNGSLRH
jgi:DNA-binding PadR family transcriptional regulator